MPASRSSEFSSLPDHVAGALCYAFGAVSAVFFLTLEPYHKRPVVRFHAWQSLFFAGVVLVGWLAMLLLAFLAGLLPVVGQTLAMLVFSAFLLALVGAWLYAMVQAYRGKDAVLPLIGRLARDQV
jgi:uncharacterized membrane protein